MFPANDKCRGPIYNTIYISLEATTAQIRVNSEKTENKGKSLQIKN